MAPARRWRSTPSSCRARRPAPDCARSSNIAARPSRRNDRPPRRRADRAWDDNRPRRCRRSRRTRPARPTSRRCSQRDGGWVVKIALRPGRRASASADARHARAQRGRCRGHAQEAGRVRCGGSSSPLRRGAVVAVGSFWWRAPAPHRARTRPSGTAFMLRSIWGRRRNWRRRACCRGRTARRRRGEIGAEIGSEIIRAGGSRLKSALTACPLGSPAPGEVPMLKALIGRLLGRPAYRTS